jgi:hypothetical protein
MVCLAASDSERVSVTDPSLSAPAPLADKRQDSRTALVVFYALVLVAAGLRLTFVQRLVSGGLYDDGYITLRYAANIAQGRGFVYNEGEPVWGTTTPLFALILSVPARFFGVAVLESCALLIGIAASIVFWCFLAVIFEGQKVPRTIGIPILLLVMFYPAYFENSLSGMETPLILALMAASLWCYCNDRPFLLGILAALLLLARIDTLVWIGILGLAFLLRHVRTNRTAILRSLFTFVIVALPWHVYAYLTFHSLIPQSLVGKAVSHNAFSQLDWSYFVRFYHVYFPIGRLGSFAAVGILVTLVLMLMGLRDLWRGFPLLRPVAIYFFCFAAVFFCSKSPLYMWYFPPSQWVAILLTCFGVRSLWDKWLARNWRPSLCAAPYAALGVSILTYGAWADSKIVESRSVLRPWAELGDFIRDHTGENSQVFLEHIGIVGFRSNRPILDNMGLVSPEIIELKRENPGDYKWLRKALHKFQPDVVVLYAAEDPLHGKGDWDAADRAWFKSKYAFVRKIESDPAASVYFRAKILAKDSEMHRPSVPGKQSRISPLCDDACLTASRRVYPDGAATTEHGSVSRRG